MISIVTEETLDHVWQSLLPKIQRALSTDAGENYTEEYYYHSVKSGAMQMWVSHEGETIRGAGIISTHNTPKGSVVFIEILAGEKLDEWLDEVEPLLKQYARQIGATTIEALCRPGLVKKLNKWRPVATLMRLG